jgi:dihydropteroate synthase
MIWQARNHLIRFPRRPLTMGIVNINDDSFCGDGTLNPTAALEQARTQLLDGADIIDIGAESARTNRGPISVDEEIQRLLPFLAAFPELIRSMGGEGPWDSEHVWPPILSINTWRTEVIRAVLPHGGDLINDISALPTADNAILCAEHSASLLIMHSVGQPKVAHTHVAYPDIHQTLAQFFTEKMALCAGQTALPPESIILDPGIDFAKQKADNLSIYADLSALSAFHRPILLPVSRKTVIGAVLHLPDPMQRDPGTVACIAAGMRRGAHLFRVHNVAACALAVKTLWNGTQIHPS